MSTETDDAAALMSASSWGASKALLAVVRETPAKTRIWPPFGPKRLDKDRLIWHTF